MIVSRGLRRKAAFSKNYLRFNKRKEINWNAGLGEGGRKGEKGEEKGAHGRITLGRTEKGPTGTGAGSLCSHYHRWTPRAIRCVTL